MVPTYKLWRTKISDTRILPNYAVALQRTVFPLSLLVSPIFVWIHPWLFFIFTKFPFLIYSFAALDIFSLFCTFSVLIIMYQGEQVFLFYLVFPLITVVKLLLLVKKFLFYEFIENIFVPCLRNILIPYSHY